MTDTDNTENTVLVTATLFTKDGQAAFATYVADYQSLEQAIEEAMEGAVEVYREREEVDEIPEPHRFIVHADTVPPLRRVATVISSTLPAQPEDDPVQSEIVS